MGSHQRSNRSHGVGGFISRSLRRQSVDLPPVAFETPVEQRPVRPRDRDRPRVLPPSVQPAGQPPTQEEQPLSVDELCALFHSSPSLMRRELVRLGLRETYDLTAPSQDELHAWRSAHERGDPRLISRMCANPVNK